jgi:predicted HicB family RNase H-like nuclease
MTDCLRHPHGYIARIEYDEELASFHGVVVNAPSVITFYGASVEELQTEFDRSVQTYYEVCKERGLDPNKPYSGKLNLRLAPDLHGKAAAAAALADMSLNTFIADAVRRRAEEVLA